MVHSVLVSEERLFRYQRQTYRGVQGCLQEYILASLQGQRTDDVAAVWPLRLSDESCTALNRAELLTIIMGARSA